MTSRERVLARIRAGITAGEPQSAVDGAARQANVAARLAAHARHLIPARTAGKSGDELVGELRRWLELAGGELVEVVGADAVPDAVAVLLRRHNLPQHVRMGADARLARVPWSRAPQLAVVHGEAQASDTASVTHALAAVAETGTLVLASGAANPVTLSFLPECNIVMVARGDIVGPLEDAIARLRGAAGGAGGRGIEMARTLNLISGPSRSADIGGVPVLGAHGPRHLCVIVVGG